MPVIMTDELVSGTRHNGRMSPVRRFYLLLCTFDLLFTCLLWIISILVTGEKLFDEFDSQVVHYNITSSMFDTVLASGGRYVETHLPLASNIYFFRFTLSMIFYGIMSISHWWVIALTTGGTVSFLVAKVLKYEVSHIHIFTDCCCYNIRVSVQQIPASDV